MSRLQALIDALQAPQGTTSSPASAADLAHRWIFAAAGEALVIVNAQTRLIVEANLAAADLLSRPRLSLIGQIFPRGLDRASAARVQELLERVGRADCTDSVTLRAFDGGRELGMTASYFSTADGSYFLVRLSGDRDSQVGGGAISGAPTMDLIQDAAVPIVLTDLMLSVEFANRAFHDIAGLAHDEEPVGQSLTRWLDLSADDLACIAEQATARRASVSIQTTLRTQNQSTRPVTACVVVVPDGELPCCAFLIEDSVAAGEPGAHSPR